jgi:transcriptional regulator with XRE-family HTH domain
LVSLKFSADRLGSAAFSWKLSSVIALHDNVQYTAHMQALFSLAAYSGLMATKSNLRQLREAAGLSVRELARQISESPTNVSYWERSGQIPRSNVLAPIAKALGVTVEELLGEAKLRRATKPGGRLGQAFAEAAKLPRRQQQKITEVVEALVSRHADENAA